MAISHLLNWLVSLGIVYGLMDGDAASKMSRDDCVASKAAHPHLEDTSVYRTRWWAYIDDRQNCLRDVVGGYVNLTRPAAPALCGDGVESILVTLLP